jgi:hypothetical protein
MKRIDFQALLVLLSLAWGMPSQAAILSHRPVAFNDRKISVAQSVGGAAANALRVDDGIARQVFHAVEEPAHLTGRFHVLVEPEQFLALDVAKNAARQSRNRAGGGVRVRARSRARNSSQLASDCESGRAV